jgi:hypothetical protein
MMDCESTAQKQTTEVYAGPTPELRGRTLGTTVIIQLTKSCEVGPSWHQWAGGTVSTCVETFTSMT